MRFLPKSMVAAALALLMTGALTVNAQKLPNIQQGSVFARANIKIDGKATEWNDKFKAYNHATEIFYTIANDDDNVYLIVKATKPDIINKILLNGVTCTINNPGQKGISVTFPTYYKNKRPYINLKNKPSATKDTAIAKTQADSFMRAANEELIDKSKLIEIEGVKSITDSMVSVYNQEGFKAMAFFDRQINYTSELAIPVKYLPISINEPPTFKYTIRLNGAAANGAHMQLSNKGNFLIVTRGNDAPYAIPASSEYMSYAYPTDFSGEYTPAKKP